MNWFQKIVSVAGQLADGAGEYHVTIMCAKNFKSIKKGQELVLLHKPSDEAPSSLKRATVQLDEPASKRGKKS